MTAREKILAAFRPEGTPEIGAVACYDRIFIRDHWFDLTAVPWWPNGSGLVEQELAWIQDYVVKTGLAWLRVEACPSRDERAAWRYEQRGDDIWRVDIKTGLAVKLQPPMSSGNCTTDKVFDSALLPTSTREMDALIPHEPSFDVALFCAEGRNDAALAARESLDLFTYGTVPSPLWALYHSFGYEGMMVLIGTDPELAVYAGQRILHNIRIILQHLKALEVDAVWIEECVMDQISPAAFEQLNVPLMSALVQEIRRCGLKSIYYYCGNPNDRLESILQIGADAVHFEESKKNFIVDIARISEMINSRCVVFGNLDAIGILQNGTKDQLRAEIARQMAAGCRNGGRFVMSIGSPITPQTPVARVRLYTDLVREIGQKGNG